MYILDDLEKDAREGKPTHPLIVVVLIEALREARAERDQARRSAETLLDEKAAAVREAARARLNGEGI